MLRAAQGKLLCDRFVGRIGSGEAASKCDRQSPPNQKNLGTQRGKHLDKGINAQDQSIPNSELPNMKVLSAESG